jgi:hypothetical protein
MALTKDVTIDKIEILANGVFHIRQTLRAYDDDGSLIGERYHRYALVPGEDVAAQPAKIRQLTNVVWTPAIIATYRAAAAASAAARAVN